MAPTTIQQSHPAATQRLWWQVAAALAAAAGAIWLLVSLSSVIPSAGTAGATSAGDPVLDTLMAEAPAWAARAEIDPPTAEAAAAIAAATAKRQVEVTAGVTVAWHSATAYHGSGHPELADGRLDTPVVMARGESLRLITTTPVISITVWGSGDDDVVVNGTPIKVNGEVVVSLDPTTVVEIRVVGQGATPPGAMLREIVLR